MPLDPGAQRVLDLIRELGRPPIQSLTPAEAREASAKSRSVLQPEPPEVAEVEDLTCPGPPARSACAATAAWARRMRRCPACCSCMAAAG